MALPSSHEICRGAQRWDARARRVLVLGDQGTKFRSKREIGVGSETFLAYDSPE